MTVQRKFSTLPFWQQISVAILIAIGVTWVFSAVQRPQLTGEIRFASQDYEAGDVVDVKCPFSLPRFHNVECYRAIAPQNHYYSQVY